MPWLVWINRTQRKEHIYSETARAVNNEQKYKDHKK